jgi:hypothetical protein
MWMERPMSLADDLQKLEELHRNGSLNASEFAQAKAALLANPNAPVDGQLGQHLSDQLADVRYQNELAQIDRQWQIEQQRYLIADRYGRRHVPTPGMGIGGAVVGGIFGVFWTIMAFAITGSAPDAGPFPIVKVVFPLFGVLFTGAAIGYGIYCYNRAQQYQQAFQAYQARREAFRQGEDTSIRGQNPV